MVLGFRGQQQLTELKSRRQLSIVSLAKLQRRLCMSAPCPRRRLILGGIVILGLTVISVGAWQLPSEKT